MTQLISTDGAFPNRPPIGPDSVPQSLRYSHDAASFFMRLIENIVRYLEPTRTQLESLGRSYQSTGDFLIQCPEFDGLLVEVHPQGSREIGTLIRPRSGITDGFDVDLVLRFSALAMNRYSGEHGPAKLINHVSGAMGRYAGQHGLKLVQCDRCVTIEYADGMTADFAPVIDHPLSAPLHGDLHGLIPDRKLRIYQGTNPRGYSKAFNQIAAIVPVFYDSVTKSMTATSKDFKRADLVPLSDPSDVFGRLLCRLVQILKLHRDEAFSTISGGSELAPTSTFITSLASKAYQKLARVPHTGPLGLLLDIVASMPSMFDRESLGPNQEVWILSNPTAPGDNLASSMNTKEHQQAFIQWHRKLASDLERLLQAVEGRAGIDTAHRLVESAFGSGVANAIRRSEQESQSAARSVGRTAIYTGIATAIPATARAHGFFGD